MEERFEENVVFNRILNGTETLMSENIVRHQFEKIRVDNEVTQTNILLFNGFWRYTLYLS